MGLLHTRAGATSTTYMVQVRSPQSARHTQPRSGFLMRTTRIGNSYSIYFCLVITLHYIWSAWRDVGERAGLLLVCGTLSFARALEEAARLARRPAAPVRAEGDSDVERRHLPGRIQQPGRRPKVVPKGRVADAQLRRRDRGCTGRPDLVRGIGPVWNVSSRLWRQVVVSARRPPPKDATGGRDVPVALATGTASLVPPGHVAAAHVECRGGWDGQ